MKLEIDFDNKTITIKESVNLGKVIEKLKELKLNWKEYRLISDTVYYPYYPYYPIYPTYPYYPYQPLILWEYNTESKTIAPVTTFPPTTSVINPDNTPFTYTNTIFNS